MPTYEYRCPEGHTFDVFQKMSDDPVATCPECGRAAERQISRGAGFLFKGEGFYTTDYRSKDYREKAKGEKPAPDKPKDAGGKDGSSKGSSSTGSEGSGSSSGDG
jgi:putative FmdB family regulatory protein